MGFFVLKSGLRILIWTPHFRYTPKSPKWVILAILLTLVIFPLKFPLNPKNFTANGRKGRTSKTKTVLKSVNKTEQLVGMSKSKREKIQNKNHPTVHQLIPAQV